MSSGANLLVVVVATCSVVAGGVRVILLYIYIHIYIYIYINGSDI